MMKNHIRELIEKRNIKRIVYVDNEFEIDIYKESIKSYLRENISDTSIEWPFSVLQPMLYPCIIRSTALFSIIRI